ncbi:hypothetical protein AB6A40_011388 [Gnathostoma spinigerum]|uniref:Uncharacterized protein n=1 Tax=Gnathostoma spinigerum TaxID=75299 RepID=A0ABD6F398_9BILA
MTNQIEVIHVGESEMIVDVVQSHSDKSFTFCMCNPPFFQNDETEQKFVHLDDESMHNQLLTEGSRRAPHSATTARTNELSFEGGEVAFVGRIIEDSVILKNAIRYLVYFLLM